MSDTTKKQLEDRLKAANKVYKALPDDDPRKVEVAQIRAEPRAKLQTDAAREVHAETTDEQNETRLSELTADDGEEAIAFAELQDAKRLYPDRPSLNAGQASQPDPRRLKAELKYQSVSRERMALEAEQGARRAKQHRTEFLRAAVARDIETQGLAEDQTLKEQHDQAVQLGDYESAAFLRKKLSTDWQKRPWSKDVAEKAVRDAEARLDNAPGVRHVGKVIADNRKSQEIWEEDKQVNP